jgi:hypothetical protein
MFVTYTSITKGDSRKFKEKDYLSLTITDRKSSVYAKEYVILIIVECYSKHIIIKGNSTAATAC